MVADGEGTFLISEELEKLLAQVKELAPDLEFSEHIASHGKYLLARCTRNGRKLSVNQQLTEDCDEDAVRLDVLRSCLDAVRST